VKWFGEPYPSRKTPAAMFEDAEEIPAPAGATCDRCGQPVTAKERGVVGAYFNMPEAVHHYECFLRPIIGSVAHQRRECSCFQKDEPPDPESDGEGGCFVMLDRNAWAGRTLEPDARVTVRRDALDAFAEFERRRITDDAREALALYERRRL
jgi:hypothetical protein